jgi:hypothetical protein
MPEWSAAAKVAYRVSCAACDMDNTVLWFIRGRVRQAVIGCGVQVGADAVPAGERAVGVPVPGDGPLARPARLPEHGTCAEKGRATARLTWDSFRYVPFTCQDGAVRSVLSGR